MSEDGGSILKGAFSFGFNHRIVRNGAGVGHFGASPPDDDSLSTVASTAQRLQQVVVATDTNKIILQNSDSVFHAPEQVTCLAVCAVPASPERTDAVLIGTRSSLTGFDVYNNKTLFHRDMPEGVSCIKIGTVDEHEEPVIVCGCGTTIWGLSIASGADVFWTALGDDINELELCDMDGDGRNELLVGTNGVEIKVLKNASFWCEYDEGDPATALCAIRAATFAFGLSSGVVGVYGNGERLWRIKTKSRIVSLLPFPTVQHVVCVWHNGKIDVRSVESGELLCKEQLSGGSDLAAAFLSRLSNSSALPFLSRPSVAGNGATEAQQLTLVYENGRVFGLEYIQSGGSDPDSHKLMREYGQRKHNLMEELRNVERRILSADDAASVGQEKSLVPANTSLECSLSLSVERGLCLRLCVSNNVPIRAVLLFAEGIFDSECYAIHPNGDESSQLSAYFSPAKDVVTELFIKVFAGYTMDRQLHVFEVNQVLPKFATYLRVSASMKVVQEMPKSYVEFDLGVRPDQLNVWLAEKFIELEPPDEETKSRPLDTVDDDDGATPFTVRFICIRNNEPLVLELRSNGSGTLRHNDLESAGNVLQSLCAHLNVREMECSAHFPAALDAVCVSITAMEEKYEVIERLSSDWAERLNVIRECVVRAEDALAIKNIVYARKFYVRVAMLNRELVNQHTIRINARQELLDALKALNLSIEQFSRLRMGSAASRLIQQCRKAVVEENLSIIPKLLQYGTQSIKSCT